MTTAAATKIKNVTIYGLENVPTGGVLIIPSRLGFSDLLSLEKALSARSLVYLTEQGAQFSAPLKSHLETERLHVLEIATGSTNPDALRLEIQSVAAKGNVIIYVPSEVLAPGAPLCTVPGAKLDFLMQAQVPVLPLHVLHTNDLVMAIERSRPAGEAVFSFGAVMAEGSVAAYQESLMLLAENSFSRVPLLDLHLARALLLGLKKHGARACLIDGKDERTFGFDKILAMAIVLSRHIRSVTKKARVGIMLPPCGAATVANVAVLLAGKVPVNLNFTSGRAAIESAMKQAETDHYITSDLFVRKVQSFPWPPNRQLTFIERLLPMKKGAIVFWAVISKLLPTSILAKVLGVPKKGGDSEATLLFTSGSSGDPKGVIMSHRNLMANICQFSSRLNLKRGDSILGCLPLFHCFGSTVTLWYPIVQGINVVTYPTPLEIKKLAELVLKHKITVMISTPTFLRGYLRGVNPEMLASLSLIVTGAEKLPKAVAEAFEARFGKKVYEGYGLTETSPVSNVNLPNPESPNGAGDSAIMRSHCFGSVGQLVPGLALKITSPESDAPLSVHQSGMVWFKGVNVFKGYLKNPKKTEEVIKDGWFRTGDIGRMDADGFLYIEGRLSRFSKIGGEMVPHETVEENLVKALGLEGESSRRIAVVGIPDVDKGEALVLLTTLPGGSVQQEILDLRYKLLDRGMTPLWIPKKMIRVQEIPVLASGKLDIKACEVIAKTA